ncbi:Hypothetical protein PPUBIRD1_1939 [Pseudomonas putida BIRD-1]|uniref:hypothetical protein n=1 Tax=Pseudomonas putida TaxID=303 RepID=UPI0001F32116|nr:hypothetical protein [Pseudomonas putida]ADR59588.1 Hypothetical protein PPUBIRD1_1939 [Pseudomonas putida BIRD-1]
MIKQRTPFDCGIATLANALYITYEQSLALYGQDKQHSGVTIQQTASILFSLSYAPVYTAFPGFVKASGISMSTASPDVLETLGHPAILQVLTPGGTVHQVWFDGKNIFDPAPSVNGPRSVSEYVCVDAVFVIKNNQALVRKQAVPCAVREGAL